MLVINFGIMVLFGWINGDVLSMILIVGVFCFVMVYYVIFFINFLVYIWGSCFYIDINIVWDNGVIVLFIFGEGYYNYYYIFEYDYCNGIKWY